MNTYLVSIELLGEQIPVGALEQKNDFEAVFSYSESYLNRPGIRPISISLPLQKEPFSPEETRRYFDGLLPEGFTRRSVAQWLQASEDDYLSILHGLGRECLGAVRISVPNEAPEASYMKLDMEAVPNIDTPDKKYGGEIFICHGRICQF